MALPVGALSFVVKAAGGAKGIKNMGNFTKKFSQMNKKVGPTLKKLTAGFKKFGLIASVAFASLIAASPLLRARLEILSLRVQELIRVFGDALAPILEFVTDLVVEATKIWNDLPEPLQQAILFGVQVVAVLGAVALAFMAVNFAMSPITAIILGIIAVFAMFHLAYTENLMGFADHVKNLFDSVKRVLEGFINFFTSIFSGDLEGAWDAIEDIFKGAIDFIIEYVTLIPRAILGVIDWLTGGAVTQLFEAGYELFNAFILGIQEAWDETVGWIRDVLVAIFGEGTGGHEEGRIREQGIAGGGGAGGGDTTKTYNIDTIAISLPNVTENDTFTDQFDSDIDRRGIV